VIKQRLCRVLSVGPARKFATHAPPCARSEARHGRAQGIGTILVAQRAQTLGAEPVLPTAAQITDNDLRHAAVIAKDRLDLAIDPIPGPIADRGNEDAIMKNLARGRTEDPGTRPPTSALWATLAPNAMSSPR
jgi:hypothetical protein